MGYEWRKKHPVLYIKWYHMIGQQIWVMIKPYVANIVSDFGKLPSACLGSWVKGGEARTPEQLWNLFFYCISLFGLKTPYVGCVICNVTPTSRCVENTAGSKTRGTDTRHLCSLPISTPIPISSYYFRRKDKTTKTKTRSTDTRHLACQYQQEKYYCCGYIISF